MTRTRAVSSDSRATAGPRAGTLPAMPIAAPPPPAWAAHALVDRSLAAGQAPLEIWRAAGDDLEVGLAVAAHLLDLFDLDAAERVLAAVAGTESRISRLYQLAFGRPPTAAEIGIARDFIATQASALGIAGDAQQQDPRPWADLGHALVNVKEFIYLH